MPNSGGWFHTGVVALLEKPPESSLALDGLSPAINEAPNDSLSCDLFLSLQGLYHLQQSGDLLVLDQFLCEAMWALVVELFGNFSLVC